MNIETKFSCGDSIWIARNTGVVGPFLIGKISVEYIASQEGPDPDSIFGNVGRQAEKYVERYMCFETGIGTGTCWDFENCFATEQEAIERVAYIQQLDAIQARVDG